MIYLVLLIVLIGFLLWFSFHVDKVFNIRKDAFVDSILVLIAGTALQCVMLLMPYYPDIKIWSLLGKITIFVHMMFLMFACFYCIQFPTFKRSFTVKLLKGIIAIAAIYFVFTKIQSVSLSLEKGTVIVSGQIIQGLNITWMQAIEYFFLYLMPLVTIIVMLIKPSNRKTPLARQKMLINILAFLIFEAVYFLFQQITPSIPMLNSLNPIVYTILLFFLYKSVVANMLFDLSYLGQKVLEILLLYLIPGSIAGVGIGVLVSYRQTSPAIFLLISLVIVVTLMTYVHLMKKYFAKKRSAFTESYEKQLEKELASLDYDGGAEEVTGNVDMILSNNIGTTGMTILMANGMSFDTVYSTTGLNYSIPTDDPVFDTLLNINRNIVFKNQLDQQYSLSSVKDKMRVLFQETNSEVCILFVESRRLLGIMLLNEKRLGNMYTQYDYSVFQKLYSYFFLIGYYMHSMANESVVGTVNREIKMSDQIIRSIQENMDFIKNPKVDAGYLMVPAHNIGGEFIDFIRLTDDRHILVLGSMSGKGITASMSMVILKSIIRTFLAETKDFKELIQKVNAFIRFNLPKGTFFSGLFALVDFKANVMYYINCGVPALMLYTQAYNNVIEIQGDGKVLGFAKNIEKLLKVKKVSLNAGDIIFACTDGLIESHSLRGEIFGKDRIQKSILENMNYTSEKIAQFTYDNLLSFTSKELEADITILALKYIGAKKPTVEQAPVAPAQEA